MPASPIAALLIAALCSIPAYAADADAARYDSVDRFIDTIPDADHQHIIGAYGELSGRAHKDWAGLVYFNDAKGQPLQQLFILTQGDNGKYQLAASNHADSAFGGTALNGIDQVKIARSSITITSSWNWHGCRGGATHQFKYYKGQWRLIGVSFQRTNAKTTTEDDQTYFDASDSITVDRNVLTGNIILKSTSATKKKGVTETFRVAPEVLLFSDYESQQGWLDRFNGYADC